ncbi:MAG: LysR family transcriptional regulator [Gammaproteobacteria bacterium]
MKRTLQSAARRMEWGDLQYILAVADTGSLAGAAAVLRVNRTTVLRRIRSFEQRNGIRLFDRLPSGYALTPAGERLLAAARELEHTILTLERKLAGVDQRAEGTVHLTTTDTLLASILPPYLRDFREAHPGILLDVSVSNTLANLTRREAEVAIRPVIAPPESLVGRRIGSVAFAVYASPRYAGADDPSKPLHEHAWLAPSAALAHTSVARWMSDAIPQARRVAHLDSLLGMKELCATGAGLAALPCYLGDTDSRLVRVRPPMKEMTTALWVLTHRDLTRTTRFRLFMQFMGAALSRERPLIEGRRVSSFG